MYELKKLIQSADQGKVIKEGIQAVIVGKPNAGKSSILNKMSGRDRAIVTDIEGTTRDIIEEEIQIQGLNLNIIDTAGIRTTDNKIEKIGVEKTKKYAKEADLIIYVIDVSKNFDENDKEIIKFLCNKKSIILLNKTDLDTIITKEILQKFINEQVENEGNYFKLRGNKLVDEKTEIPVIEISAIKEKGLEKIGQEIYNMFLKGEVSFNDEIYITNVRQKNALKNAYECLNKVKESIYQHMPEDFYSIDLMDAYEELGSITGETTGEDLINEIFSKFCMGK